MPKGGRRPIASLYSPKEYADWQRELLDALRGVEAVRFNGLVVATVESFPTRPKTTKLLVPKPDVDNYAKGVLDCITKDTRFWSDDTQVADLLTRKRWAKPDEPGHIIVTLEPLEL